MIHRRRRQFPDTIAAGGQTRRASPYFMEMLSRKSREMVSEERVKQVLDG